MPDIISSEERALIDSAVQGGKITRIPAHVVSDPVYRSAWPPKPQKPVADRRKRVADLARAGVSATAIAQQLGIALHTVRNDLFLQGISLRAKKAAGADNDPKPRDKALAAKEASARRKVEKIADRRRFKVTPVPLGPPLAAPPDITGTMFPTRVSDPAGAVLIDGANNAKIGGDVFVGALQGARIVTLTLEERATCPQSCDMWATCYGNTMPHPRRWRHGPELIDAITRDLSDLCARHDKVLVRLHILGDFWSVDYVDFWRQSLTRHPNLHVFGFTAWPLNTPIGAAVADLRSTGRWWIRHSGITGPWGAFTIDFPTERKRLGDAIVCPEQVDSMSGGTQRRHCGNCAVCWSTDRPIVFKEH